VGGGKFQFRGVLFVSIVHESEGRSSKIEDNETLVLVSCHCKRYIYIYGPYCTRQSVCATRRSILPRL